MAQNEQPFGDQPVDRPVQSELHYRRMYESIRDAVAVVDMTGSILECNPAFADMLGYGEEELRQLTYMDLTPPRWHAVEARIIAAQVLATGASTLYEKEYVHKDGHLLPVELRTYLIRDATGQPEQMWAIVRDITERKLADAAVHRSEERLLAFVNASSSIVYRMSPDWREMLHLDGQAAIADTESVRSAWVGTYIHPEDQPQVMAAIRHAIQTRSMFDLEHRVRRLDGTLGWTHSRAIPILDAHGDIVEWFGAAADITARKDAETALRVAGESFRQLVEHSPFGVYAVDADFRLVMASAGAQHVFRNVGPLLGRDLEEVLRVLWPEHFVSDMLERFRHTLETGEPYHAPSSVAQRADIGETQAYDWQLERVALPDGRPGVVCHFYDLSERQRYETALRASEDRYRTLLEATNAVTWTCPPSGLHATPQPSWMAFTGQAEEEVIGDGWTRAIHPDDVAAVAARWQDAVARGMTFTSEHRVRRRDGLWRWMQMTAAPVRDEHGLTVEWFGATLDITDRKRVEDDLREADRRKDEFVAILAHELRNPLAPIRTALALLRTRELSDPILLRSRDVIDRQVTHMARLLDDLLDVSRLSRGTLTLRRSPVALGDVLSGAIETAAPLIEQRTQALVVEGLDAPIAIDGDPARLVQVFGNLLTNASKFSPADASITVAVRLDGDCVSVTVRDTGDGIAAEHLETVFDLFSQVQTDSHASKGGLGIGLSLVRRLVELHGGTITAASDGVGRGSSFTVTLPAMSEPAALQAQPTATESSRVAVHRRVLVADDNTEAAETVALLLTELGCEVRAVYGGEPALREAQTFRPDLALLDIGMPDLDGREVCRRIRSEPWGTRIRIVALSGWGREDDQHGSLLAGFDQHLVKPADPAALMRLVQELPLPGAAAEATAGVEDPPVQQRER